LKSNADKAINYLQLYRMDHEASYLIEAGKIINRELAEIKKEPNRLRNDKALGNKH